MASNACDKAVIRVNSNKRKKSGQVGVSGGRAVYETGQKKENVLKAKPLKIIIGVWYDHWNGGGKCVTMLFRKKNLGNQLF